MKEKNERFMVRVKKQYKESPAMFIVYFVLRLIVVLVMVAQFLNRDYNNVFLCILTLLLFTLPSFVEKKIKIDIPNTLEVIILLFIFAAEILGEIREFYVNIPFWDTMLHTMNGFLCAAIGIALIDILNRSERCALSLSPFFVALMAFCFSMTIGVLWEFFEFGMDQIFLTDMQKDTWIGSISSFLIDPTGKNILTKETIDSVVVNGREWQGYLDIGLLDTMKDLIVNFIGAVFFSTIGYFYIKHRGKGKFVKRFMLTKIPEAPEQKN